jgi:hypothetical protein
MELDGVEYVCEFVSECRARMIPLAQKHVSYKTMDGKSVAFETDRSGKNISPNSEGRIIRRLGSGWRQK